MDEMRVTLDDPDGWSKRWVLHGQARDQRLRRQQGGGGIMVWAEILVWAEIIIWAEIMVWGGRYLGWPMESSRWCKNDVKRLCSFSEGQP